MPHLAISRRTFIPNLVFLSKVMEEICFGHSANGQTNGRTERQTD